MLGFFDPARASPTALAWRKRLASNDNPPELVHENIEKSLDRHKYFNRDHSELVKRQEMRKGISVDDHVHDSCNTLRQRPGSIQQTLKPGKISAAQSNYLANKLEQKFGVRKKGLDSHLMVQPSRGESSSTFHGSSFRGGALACLSPSSSTNFRSKTGGTDFEGAASSELSGLVLLPPISPVNTEFPARPSLSGSPTNFHQLHADSSFSPGTSQTNFQKMSMASAVLGGSSSEGALRPNSKGFNVSFGLDTTAKASKASAVIGKKRERRGVDLTLGSLGSLGDGSPKNANPVEREKLRREQFAAERAQRRKAYYSSLQSANERTLINSQAEPTPQRGLGLADVALTSQHSWYKRFKHVH